MAMNKIERLDREIQKTREKITEYQNKLKELTAQKTEAENLQIVQLVRAMRLTPQELTAMLSGDATQRMKNKIKRTLTALCAALMLMGGFSVTAFAQTPENDATNDTGVVVEETEDTPPLTPDGNATLVDDYGGNKQLITVTTKSGNYFYIIIDRDDEGENTVHFLNQVDEADLMALMEDEDGQTEETPAVCNCTDKCEAGAVNTACPVCSVNLGDCTGKEAEPEEPEQPEEETQGNIGGILLIVLILAGGGGAAFYYFKVLKPKKDAAKGNDNLDEYDFDDYDEDEEADGELPDDAAADEQEDETV